MLEDTNKRGTILYDFNNERHESTLKKLLAFAQNDTAMNFNKAHLFNDVQMIYVLENTRRIVVSKYFHVNFNNYCHCKVRRFLKELRANNEMCSLQWRRRSNDIIFNKNFKSFSSIFNIPSLGTVIQEHAK
jgi:hypothetical protein